MEYKELLKIMKLDGRLEAAVNITSEDDFQAVIVSLTSILHRNKRLALMVLIGLQARSQDPDSFDKNETIVQGGMPWDNDTKTTRK